MDKPDAKPPSVDFIFFATVSFELVLLSVEQSLRLLFLLHYSIVRNDKNHNLHVLYRALQNKSGKQGIRQEIVNRINELGQTKEIDSIDEEDLVACFKKHTSSYSNFRYFQLDRYARLNKKWEFSSRDDQILYCLAVGLIDLNMDEMERRDITPISSMRRIPKSEMTEELKALVDRLVSG